MATKVAIQLIAWGERARRDLRDVLQEVRETGYAGVETNPRVLERVSRELEEFGLSLVGVHLSGGDIGPVPGAMDLLEKLEGKFLIFSGIGGRTGNLEGDYGRAAEFLNRYCLVKNERHTTAQPQISRSAKP
ncbi:TPA: hypothetical protein EYP12_07515, partial [Candidatus Bipolaricaulota bacterium]|nr:hypothetical protein [Candidatus Bipolaricaulota bacterium]